MEYTEELLKSLYENKVLNNKGMALYIHILLKKTRPLDTSVKKMKEVLKNIILKLNKEVIKKQNDSK